MLKAISPSSRRQTLSFSSAALQLTKGQSAPTVPAVAVIVTADVTGDLAVAAGLFVLMLTRSLSAPYCDSQLTSPFHRTGFSGDMLCGDLYDQVTDYDIRN